MKIATLILVFSSLAFSAALVAAQGLPPDIADDFDCKFWSQIKGDDFQIGYIVGVMSTAAQPEFKPARFKLPFTPSIGFVRREMDRRCAASPGTKMIDMILFILPLR